MSGTTPVPLPSGSPTYTTIPALEWWEPLVRILISIALGGIIGIEREFVKLKWHVHGMPGLRTHILVSGTSCHNWCSRCKQHPWLLSFIAGSCLLQLVSVHGYADEIGHRFTRDPARLAAQVVSGIGFLGAGAIISDRDSGHVRGLTTAASLWMCMAIGLASGVGYWYPAVASALLVTVILLLFGKLRVVLEKNYSDTRIALFVTCEVRDEPTIVESMISSLKSEPNVLAVELERVERASGFEPLLFVTMKALMVMGMRDRIFKLLHSVPGMYRVICIANEKPTYLPHVSGHENGNVTHTHSDDGKEAVLDEDDEGHIIGESHPAIKSNNTSALAASGATGNTIGVANTSTGVTSSPHTHRRLSPTIITCSSSGDHHVPLSSTATRAANRSSPSISLHRGLSFPPPNFTSVANNNRVSPR